MVERELIEVLKWYGEMGVDTPVAASPSDWFSLTALGRPPAGPAPVPGASAGPAVSSRGAPGGRGQALGASAHRPARQIPSSSRPPSDDAAIMEARERAKTADTLEALKAALAEFEGCALKRTAKNLCFADGQPDAPLMIIGEAPGRDEDMAGRPFVGRAGQLLDRILAAIGRSREKDVYITNTVFWRPPGNRTPAPQETQACLPFLERQILLVRPRVVVLLGGAAAKTLLGTTQGIMRLRGKWRELPLGTMGAEGAEGGEGKQPKKGNSKAGFRAMASLHPAYLLRNPSAKALIWKDFLSVEEALSQTD